MIDKEYIKKLREDRQKAVAIFNSDDQNKRLLKSDGKGGQPGNNGATFLYIRAFEGDIGTRPVTSGVVFWLSPDIELFDLLGTHITTTEVTANKDYNVKVTVSNEGDQDCNSCTVELYLDDPSIGFSVIASKLLGSKTISVNSQAKTTVEFPFKATNDMSGHKCMFARAYSIMSNDYPIDFNNFKTSQDRHIGQHNLDIIRQGTLMTFTLNPGFIARSEKLSIYLNPDIEIVKKMKLPIIGKYFISSKKIKTAAFKFSKIAVTQKQPVTTGPSGRIDVIRRGRGTSVPRLGTRLVPVSPVPIDLIKKNEWTHEFNPGLSRVQLEIPMLGLNSNEAVPMDITIADSNTGMVIGGITLFVVG